MLELVLTVCSLVQGASCRDLNAIQLGQVSMMTCAFASQVEGAKWVGEHPNFYIARSTCQPANRVVKI
jgi:hypothetical protein